MAKYLQSCMEKTSTLLKRPEISRYIEDLAQALLQKKNIKLCRQIQEDEYGSRDCLIYRRKCNGFMIKKCKDYGPSCGED